MWFIGVEVEQETSAPPPEKNPGSAPEVSYKDKRMSILYRTLQKKLSVLMYCAIELYKIKTKLSFIY